MKEREIDIPNSPGIRKLLMDFCNAKMSIYKYSKEEFDKKTENFFKNIKKITISEKKSSSNVEGSYNSLTKKLHLYLENINEISGEAINAIVHELNHAWNFEPHKRRGIMPPIISSLNSKFKKRLDFYIWDEALNEAETQALCSSILRTQKGYISKENIFYSYSEEESIFEMLCIISNQSGINFLKDIEGQNIFEIITHISNQSKVPEEEVDNTIQTIAALYSRLKVNASKFNFLLSSNMRTSYEKYGDIIGSLPDMNIKEGQQIYETLKNFIQNSGYNQEEKKLILLKLEALQDRMAFRFFPFRI